MQHYYNPDYFWMYGAASGGIKTFLVNEKRVLTTKPWITHNSLIKKRGLYHHEFTRGRTGEVEGNKYVAFWSTNKNILHLLPLLIKRKVIDKTFLIWNESDQKYRTVGEALQENKLIEQNEAKLKLWERLHLAVGAEKRALLKLLGVGSSKQNLYRAACLSLGVYYGSGD